MPIVSQSKKKEQIYGLPHVQGSIVENKSEGAKQTKITFPPKPIAMKLEKKIIADYCNELKHDNVIEEGCAVCSQLNLTKEMEPLS
ncbi:hypothetical protein DENSPDRAFT_774498, partial [Dentipellis sp. KUC8613]